MTTTEQYIREAREAAVASWPLVRWWVQEQIPPETARHLANARPDLFAALLELYAAVEEKRQLRRLYECSDFAPGLYHRRRKELESVIQERADAVQREMEAVE